MMHFVSAVPNAGPFHEFKGFNTEIPINCSTSDLESHGGVVKVPTGPGMGVEIDPLYIANTNTIDGIWSPHASCSPNQSANPDDSKPLANANPPPKSRTMFQGRRLAVFQFIMCSSGLFFDGQIKSNNEMKIAVVPSLINAGLLNIAAQPGTEKPL